MSIVIILTDAGGDLVDTGVEAIDIDVTGIGKIYTHFGDII